MAELYAGVYLLDAPFCIDRIYDYRIPKELENEVHKGSFVSVPFGNGNRPKVALVFSVSDKSEYKELKPITDVVSSDISMDDKMLSLALFMKEHTLCTVGEAIHTMIPSKLLSKLGQFYKIPALCDNTENAKRQKQKANLSPFELSVLNYIEKAQIVSDDTLKGHFGLQVKECISSLLSSKLIEKELVIQDSENDRLETVYSIKPQFLPDISKLINGEKVGGIQLRSQKQKDIISALYENADDFSQSNFLSNKEIAKELNSEVSLSPQLKALCEKGIICKSERKLDFSEDCKYTKAETEIRLSEHQKKAYETLQSLADSGSPKAALLFGVTGSGKTSVILKTIDHVISNGKSAIVLLPEIALTPQSISIFKSHYGENVAVIHSRLSMGERSKTYLKIRNGNVKVVLGTRSAIFAPVKNLGVIVIDEEQEHTYKSDKNPKYHAKDIARKRCADENALMLLSSATPSLESYQKALEGKYTFVKLTERYGNARLPEVIIADMRNEAKSGNTTPIGTLLASKLIENENNHNQSILFINRRGYNNFISCRSCGEVITCPHCSVAMTYHTKKGTYDKGELVCHWCGTKMQVPSKCPNCESEHLAHMGYGTQRIEQELKILLEGTKASVLRMDTDTTKSKFSYDKLLSAFREKKASILLGTQMVTKGHDFPNVTLVGVLLADSSLYMDDYRASERTFDLITQVVGRAGRADKEGLAIIQTNNPDSEVIRLACEQDYETFAKRELTLRKLLVFPPYCDIVLITIQSSYEKELMLCANQLAKMLQNMIHNEFSDVALIPFGPFEAPVYKVENKYRMRMVIKCRLNKRSRSLFRTIMINFSKPGSSKINMSVDFNPSSL